MVTTLYIVPAWSDQAGQCRIVAREGQWAARDSYLVNASKWLEVGLMDSRGKVRCIEPEFASLREDEPLMAGTQYRFPRE